jgi:hypothetical protein
MKMLERSQIHVYRRVLLDIVTMGMILTSALMTGLFVQMANSSSINNIVNDHHDTNGATNGTEYDALINLYMVTHGDEWINTNGWRDAARQAKGLPSTMVLSSTSAMSSSPLVSSSFCNWFGITCDADEHVIAIDLRTNNLNGYLPSLCALTHLTSINMLANRLLSGQIPSLCCHVPLMKTIILGQTNVDGPLPSCLADMPLLDEVDVLYNPMSGPDLNVLDRLHSLTGLRLSGRFGGVMPSMANVTRLGWFFFRSLLVNSTLPSGMCNWKHLTGMAITDTIFTGGLPSCLSDTQMSAWYVARNPYLTGTIPALPLTISSARILTNGFDDIVSPIANLPRLSSLTLNHNRLRYFPVLFNLPILYEFNINENQVTGDVRIESMLPSLTLMDISKNGLSGSLNWTSLIPSIATLNLADNAFNSSHTKDLHPGSKLRDLVLSGNPLNWTYPEMDYMNPMSPNCPIVPSAPALLSLQLSRTGLSGPYASMLYCLNEVYPNLITLDASMNALETPLAPLQSEDEVACNITQIWPKYLIWLQTLDISHNHLRSVTYITYSRVPHTFVTVGCMIFWTTVNLQQLDIRGNQM